MTWDSIVIPIFDLTHLLNFPSLKFLNMVLNFTLFQFILIFALLNHTLLSVVFLLFQFNLFLIDLMSILSLKFLLFLSCFAFQLSHKILNVFNPQLFFLGKAILVSILLKYSLLAHCNSLLSLSLKLVNVHVVIDFNSFSLRPKLCLFSYPYPSLHELKVWVEVVSPLSNLGLTH